MAVEPRIDNETYCRLALERPDRKLESIDGRLREKPRGSYRHNQTGIEAAFLLMAQLDWSVFHVRVEAGRLHVPEATYYVPDAFVFPVAMAEGFVGRDDLLEVYDRPVPLVVEVWCRLAGEDTIRRKLADYQARGDAEIWFLHPFARTLTAWRRRKTAPTKRRSSPGGRPPRRPARRGDRPRRPLGGVRPPAVPGPVSSPLPPHPYRLGRPCDNPAPESIGETEAREEAWRTGSR